jgi:methanogenic corrinoid protein MtbC1
LLVPAQSDVGSKWHDGSWSVAEEHLATTCTDAVLSAVTAEVHPPRFSRGKVVVACVEEECHSLPARLFAELLLYRGWKQSFLGVSIPVHSLKKFLENTEPLALALSCSVAMNMVGAADCIDAAHSLGIPVIVGGRGFGCNDLRARKIHADAWGQSIDDACKTLGEWAVRKPIVVQHAHRYAGEDIDLMAAHQAITSQALASLRARFKAVADLPQDRARLLESDLSIHLRFVESALLTEDPTVYTDFLSWSNWSAPGVAPVDGFTADIVDALAAAVPDGMPATARLYATARALLRRPAGVAC